jgi:hypothetical protein
MLHAPKFRDPLVGPSQRDMTGEKLISHQADEVGILRLDALPRIYRIGMPARCCQPLAAQQVCAHAKRVGKQCCIQMEMGLGIGTGLMGR